MDLIYTDASRTDIGVLFGYTLDLAYGKDENNFELELSNKVAIDYGALIYIEGTEYGGIVDSVELNTADDTIKYKGRTFHGILDSKVIVPPSGSAYKVVSGEANAMVSGLITDLGLTDLFSVSSEVTTITIPSTNVDRYITAYAGINKILKDNSAKLKFAWENGKINLSCEALVDYAALDEYSSDHYQFNIFQERGRVNHLICLGSGELTERQVVNLYVDDEGTISTTQYYFDDDEYAAVYDYPNVESLAELEKEGREKLKELYNSDSAELEIIDDELELDINDIVGATEEITQTTITNSVIKKIIKIHEGLTEIDYEVGD